MVDDASWPPDPLIASSPAGVRCVARCRCARLTPAQDSVRALMASLANKSVVFVGDSINNLIFRAGLCEAAKVFTVADLKAFHAVTDANTRMDMASKCAPRARALTHALTHSRTG